MHNERLIPISEFARLTGMKRPNLIFYDDYGLLKPERVGANGYRYYGIRQFGTAYLIMTLKEFGMSLKEIKAIARDRTPESIAEVFMEQEKQIERQIDIYRQKLLMVRAYRDTLKQAAPPDEEAIVVKELPAEPLVYGPVIKDFDKGRSSEYYIDFVNAVSQQGLSFGFPLGSMVTKSSLLKNRWGKTSRLYYRAAASQSKRGTGLYAVGYSRGDFFDHEPLYQRMGSFISENGYVIAGNSYEDYLLDELSVTDPDEYLVRLSVRVDKKRRDTIPLVKNTAGCSPIRRCTAPYRYLSLNAVPKT